MLSNYEFNKYKDCIDSCLASMQSKIDALSGVSEDYILGDGSSSQYIRGDGSKATFPTIPTNSTFVDKITDQVDIGGDKTYTGRQTINNNLIVGGDITSDGNGSRSVGGPTSRYANVWSNNVLSAGVLTLGSSAANNAIQIRQGSVTQIIAGFHPTTGEFIIQASASTLAANTNERVQIYGSLKVTADIKAPGLQVFADNTAAAGLATGVIYRTLTGEIRIKV